MRGKLQRPDVFRQSLLAGFETCPRRTRFAIQAGDDITTGWVGASGALGSAFHEVAAEILRTLYRLGETQIATQEAVEIMYEVLGKSSIVLPTDEREDLRWLVLGFCAFPWQPKRIMALEETLTTEIAGPDGELRTLKGQPDVLLADPPKGLVIVDFKSGRGKPRAPRQKPQEGETVTGKQYLSDRGHFQLDCYGLLALRAYPTAEYVTLRELHLRSGEVREATLTRPELEHVERELGLQMMQLDRAIFEGPKSELWAPRPGSHCVRQCPVARSCPVPSEMRGDGALDTHPKADRAARAWAVLSAKREQLRDQLKAVHEETGYAPMVNESQVVRWDPPVGPGRKFGIHSKVDSEGAA